MNGADLLVKCLEKEEVDVVFGYPGVAICPFYNSILESDIESILVRTEQNAAHAASGEARVTGKVGVCAVTSGPGLIGALHVGLQAAKTLAFAFNLQATVNGYFLLNSDIISSYLGFIRLKYKLIKFFVCSIFFGSLYKFLCFSAVV